MAVMAGIMPSEPFSRADATLRHELAQYDRIIALRDDVIAGRHPRLKAHAVAAASHPLPSKVSMPQGVVRPSVPIAPTSNQASNALAAVKNISSTTTANAVQLAPQSSTISNSTATPRGAPNLTQETLQQKRARLESQLDKTAAKKPLIGRAHENDSVDELDVSEILQKAQERVKPVTKAAQVNGKPLSPKSSSPSAGKASPYSSQMNESTTDEAGDSARQRQRRRTKPCKYFFEGSCRRGDACSYSHDPAFRQQLQRNAPLTATADNAPDPAKRPSAGLARPVPQREPANDRSGGLDSGREPGEVIEDACSPAQPQPMLTSRPEGAPVGPRDSRAMMPPPPPTRQIPRLRSPVSTRNNGVPTGPRDGPVIRNHITSPAAPRPSRVSPLATARLSHVDRVRQAEGPETSPRTYGSPRPLPVNPSNMSSRKRPREPDAFDANRNVLPRQEAIPIKAEPVSPPPLIEAPPHGISAARRPSRMLIDLEDPVAPRHDRNAYLPVARTASRVERAYDLQPPSPYALRIVSGPEPMHSDEDYDRLPRRIASARYLETEAPRHPQARYVSASVAQRISRRDSPIMVMSEHEAVNPRASMPPRQYEPYPAQRRYEELHEGRPLLEHDRPSGYAAFRPLSPIDVPPTARIVVDEAGNRYYETIRTERRRPQAYAEGGLDGSAPALVDSDVPRVASVRPSAARVYQESSVHRRSITPEAVRYVEHRPPLRSASRATYYDSRPTGAYADVQRDSQYAHAADHPSLRPSTSMRFADYPTGPPVERSFRAVSALPRESAYGPASARYGFSSSQNGELASPRHALLPSPHHPSAASRYGSPPPMPRAVEYAPREVRAASYMGPGDGRASGHLGSSDDRMSRYHGLPEERSRRYEVDDRAPRYMGMAEDERIPRYLD